MNLQPEHVRRGRRLLLVPVVLLMGGIVITWAWNTLAADLLAQPGIRLRHAIAVELLLAVAVTVVVATRRLLGSRRP